MYYCWYSDKQLITTCTVYLHKLQGTNERVKCTHVTYTPEHQSPAGYGICGRL